jgi:3-oxoacyl-[acyl-carrier-protein] synthase II
MSKRRVVVTGLGIISPVGIGLAPAWENILAGRSGITRITRFDAHALPSRIAGEVKDFDVTKHLSGKEARRYDTFIHYGLVATMEAVRDAGLEGYGGDLDRAGVCIGSGIGGLPMIEDTARAYAEGGPRKISPFFVPGSIINMIAGLVSIHYGYRGPNLGTVSACSTANHSFGEAARLIEYGDADVMISPAAPRQRSARLASEGSARRARSRRATTIPRRPAGRGMSTATASSSGKARASSCSRRWSTPRRAVRASTASWRATACRPTPTTSLRRPRTGLGRRAA